MNAKHQALTQSDSRLARASRGVLKASKDRPVRPSSQLAQPRLQTGEHLSQSRLSNQRTAHNLPLRKHARSSGPSLRTQTARTPEIASAPNRVSGPHLKPAAHPRACKLHDVTQPEAP